MIVLMSLPAPALSVLAARTPFELGFIVGAILGVPIAIWVGYKLARKLDLF
jgi:hypothetical protein